MTGVFAELQRRNVFRVGVAYVVAAWVVAQVADLVMENIGAPSWVMQSLLLLLTLGFVAALIIAWAYEVTPDGIKRERDVVRDESITHDTAKRLNVITIGLVLVAISLLLADRFFLDDTRPAAAGSAEISSARSSSGSETDAMDRGSSGTAPEKSIAVLPFVNMSPDKEQDYFADGISEEILNALVKAEGLQVSGRTSSFSFKGKDANIQEIGRALNVAHVLEGSVRKQGSQVRVTAQLIKAADGYHLWSETYDRSLENIFDVQDDISRHVSKELLKLLTPDNQGRLANAMTTNIEAYDLFLRGRDYIGKRIIDNIPTGIALLRNAVLLDPNFAEAWAVLAEAELVSPAYVVVDHDAATRRAQEYAQKAIELRPTMALPHAVLGFAQWDEGSFMSAHLALQRAYEMEPNNVLVLRWLGSVYQALGLFDKAAELFEKAVELDPMSAVEVFNKASVQFSLRNLDEAERLFERVGELRGGPVELLVADVRFAKGDIEGAIDVAMRNYDEFVEKYGTAGIWSRREAETYARGAFSTLETDRQAALELENMLLTESDDLFHWQVYLYIKIGNFERAFEIFEEHPRLFQSFAADNMWTPLSRSVEFRQHPAFPALLDRHNYTEAWQHLGWPDLCEPNPGTNGSNGQFRCN